MATKSSSNVWTSTLLQPENFLNEFAAMSESSLETVGGQLPLLPVATSLTQTAAGDVFHKPSSRLSLLSAKPMVTFPASERHRPRPVPIYILLGEQRRVYKRLG